MNLTNENVTFICQEPRIFTQTEANSLIPMLQFITSKHEQITNKLIKRQQQLVKCGAGDNEIKIIQDEINENYVVWGGKILKLGAKPLAGGAVGIDGGGFWWSWFFNEKRIEHYHMYSQGPGYRIHVSSKYDQK